MRRLIVNADDFGIHPARNRGISEAVRAGVVTSVSVIVNLEGFDDAVELLSSMPRVDVGLHFNLSEGRPVGARHGTLVGADGAFLGKDEARRRAAEGRFSPIEVRDELLAQAERLWQAVGVVTHADGHQHIHVFGAVAVAFALGAVRLDVRWTRLPAEPEDPTIELPPERSAQIDEYRERAGFVRAAFDGARLRTADHFRGLALSGRMTPERIAALARALPEGTTELMVHPGRAEGKGFDGADRADELAALLSPEFRRALDEGGVELVRRGKIA